MKCRMGLRQSLPLKVGDAHAQQRPRLSYARPRRSALGAFWPLAGTFLRTWQAVCCALECEGECLLTCSPREFLLSWGKREPVGGLYPAGRRGIAGRGPAGTGKPKLLLPAPLRWYPQEEAPARESVPVTAAPLLCGPKPSVLLQSVINADPLARLDHNTDSLIVFYVSASLPVPVTDFKLGEKGPVHMRRNPCRPGQPPPSRRSRSNALRQLGTDRFFFGCFIGVPFCF
jgi:hypothetical protein